MPPKRKASACGSPQKSPGRPAKVVKTANASCDITNHFPVKREPDEEVQTLAAIPPVPNPPSGAQGLRVSRWLSRTSDALNASALPTADIAPDGDVVLVVGHQAVRLRVYSQVLKVSSKFFADLLSTRSNSRVLEIQFPDDDPRVFNVIMRLLHRLDINTISGGLNANLVLQSAITAKALDCKEALSFGLKEWIHRLDYNRLDSNTAFILLEAMWWLGNEDAFSGFSLHLILHHVGPYLDFWPLRSDFMRFDKMAQILRALENQRERIRRHLIQLAFDTTFLPNLHRLPTCSEECHWVKDNLESWTARLPSTGLLPRIFEMSVTGFLKEATKISEPDVAPHEQCKGPKPHVLPHGHKFNQMTLENLKNLRSLTGLAFPTLADEAFSF